MGRGALIQEAKFAGSWGLTMWELHRADDRPQRAFRAAEKFLDRGNETTRDEAMRCARDLEQAAKPGEPLTESLLLTLEIIRYAVWAMLCVGESFLAEDESRVEVLIAWAESFLGMAVSRRNSQLISR
jgi:hypothetical protein